MSGHEWWEIKENSVYLAIAISPSAVVVSVTVNCFCKGVGPISSEHEARQLHTSCSVSFTDVPLIPLH